MPTAGAAIRILIILSLWLSAQQFLTDAVCCAPWLLCYILPFVTLWMMELLDGKGQKTIRKPSSSLLPYTGCHHRALRLLYDAYIVQYCIFSGPSFVSSSSSNSRDSTRCYVTVSLMCDTSMKYLNAFPIGSCCRLP